MCPTVSVIGGVPKGGGVRWVRKYVRECGRESGRHVLEVCFSVS